MAKFLNLDDDAGPDMAKIGQKLKAKTSTPAPPKIETDVVEQVASEHGFERTAKPKQKPAPPKPKLGRPALNEDMTYWTIYLSADLRDWLERPREAKNYRRLNDLLDDMREAYEAAQKPKPRKSSTARKRS